MGREPDDKEGVEDRCKLYPTSSVPAPPPIFECELKWRWQMGQNMPPDQIKLVNDRIDILRKIVYEREKETVSG